MRQRVSPLTFGSALPACVRPAEKGAIRPPVQLEARNCSVAVVCAPLGLGGQGNACSALSVDPRRIANGLLGARKGTEPPSSLRAIGGFSRYPAQAPWSQKGSCVRWKAKR